MRVVGLIAAAFWVFAVGVIGASRPADAGVRVNVSIARQRMTVYVNGALRYSWPISSGRGRYRTPYGAYSPKRLVRMHYSSRYNNAPMPCSIFFYGGYAIHGTNHTRALGRPASHGCVRLRTSNACRLYNLVARYGYRATRIVIR